MKNKKFIVLVLAVQCFLFWQSAGAQTEPRSKFYNLKFEAKPAKDKYFPLELIQVSYKIFNPTDSPVQVNWSSSIVIFSMEVNKDGKKSVPRLTNILAPHGVSFIQPNQTIEGKGVLNFALSNIFPDYGKYELTFTIRGKESGKESGGEVVSKTVEITIQQPMGINAEALNFIYKIHKISKIMYVFGSIWEDKREDKTKDPIEEFVEKYSDSVYGDYAVFTLAGIYKSQKKYDMATKEYNKLKGKKDFAYSEYVTADLEEIEQDLIRIKLSKKEN